MKHSNTHKNDEAVSPVIAVILMVAITVILAAVLASFIFGMATDVRPAKTVAIIAERPAADLIRVTNYGGANVADLTSTEIKVSNATKSYLDTSVGIAVGDTVIVPVVSGENVRVMVTGTFSDGTTVVLLDTQK